MCTPVKYSTALFLFLCVSTLVYGQDIAIGEWRSHFSYPRAIAVTEGRGKIYCAARSAIFYYDKSDGTTATLSKVNGLSDVDISTIRYDAANDVLIVAYTNANIDMVESGKVINIPDIKRKNIPGNKTINNILVAGRYAYFSCGFGIVVLDLIKKEISDTYYIGPNGSALDVRGLAYSGTAFFAATASGVYEAPANSPNLANYVSWTRHSFKSSSAFKNICYYNGKLYANTEGGYDRDTLFKYDGIAWGYFDSLYSWSIKKIESSQGKMLITNRFSIAVYEPDGTRSYVINNYTPDEELPQQGLLDDQGNAWIADDALGLVQFTFASGACVSRYPNGPGTTNVFQMALRNNKLWVVPGGRDGAWTGLFTKEGVFSFSDNTWETINGKDTALLDTINDICSVVIDPQDNNRVFVGSWGQGLLELYNGKIVNVFKENNSTIQSYPPAYWVGIGGLAFDADNNLWVVNSATFQPLSVKGVGGSWKSFSLPGLNSNSTLGPVIVDSYNQKWIILPRGGGLLVFDDNHTIFNTGDDRSKQLTGVTGNGKLPSLEVFSIVEDREKQIWIGTDKGVAVFYSPEKVFSGENFDAQQILIEQDGHAQYLLESETVTSIAVDGANRKWLGTQYGGVFLMSPDGTKQLLHFDQTNSPLPSNTITTIAVNNETGEVFFGTSKGIVSYKSTATEGGEDYADVYVYPNPVRESYSGLIAVKGLLENANVKITDVAGNLVYETTADGGQAVWNGKNFSGQKVQTGVYLVFCANTDGSKTFVTKLLFIN